MSIYIPCGIFEIQPLQTSPCGLFDMFAYANGKDRGKGLPRFFIVYIYAVLFGTAL